MTGGKDSAMDPVKAAELDTGLDQIFADSEPPQLPYRDHAMLPTG